MEGSQQGGGMEKEGGSGGVLGFTPQERGGAGGLPPHSMGLEGVGVA